MENDERFTEVIHEIRAIDARLDDLEKKYALILGATSQAELSKILGRDSVIENLAQHIIGLEATVTVMGKAIDTIQNVLLNKVK